MVVNQFETINYSTDLPTAFTRNLPSLASKLQKYVLETETRDTRINNFFSIYELKTAISNTKNTAPGHDRVCYEMFKHLSDHSPIPAVLVQQPLGHRSSTEAFAALHCNSSPQTEQTIKSTFFVPTYLANQQCL